MLLLISISISLSVIFTFLSHPLSILVVIITQTMILSIIVSMLNVSYWFSYILFLIFLGGMLVLFIYIASLASNEIFLKTSLLKIIKIFSIPFFTSLLLLYNQKNLNSFSITPQNIDINLIISKFYIHNFLLTLILILYLLITLFAVVKITKFNKGPLRSLK